MIFDEREEASKRIVLNVPEDAAEGTYYIRMEFSNDDIKRLEYREVKII